MDAALIRPDDFNFPLLVHVLGAIALVGVLTLATASLAAAWSSGSAALTRLSFRALLWAGLPAWIVNRVGAEWIADKEGLTGDEVPSWVDIGYIVSDPAFLLLVGATVLTGIRARRTARGGGEALTLDRVALALLALALLGYLIAIWAMTAKPA